MPQYHLAGLSTDSFEQLVQALSLKIVGPGGVIFGAGPDGAREATFEGPMKYPSPAEPWQGYLVMQAKFLQKPSGDAKKDGEWLLKNLEAELAKFADPKRKLRQPEYYILCSNVVLTPVWQTGTKDKAFNLFRNAGTELKGFDIWDYDKIARFLDDAQDIRAGYGAWIQPGDVLAAMMEWLGGLGVDFEKAIANYLQKELLRDHYMRLDQSGPAGRPYHRVPVERVFVDLPASRQPVTDPPKESAEKGLPPGIVATLLNLAASKWDPATLRHFPSPRTAATEELGKTGRVVLIGGPGQGKSTTGQYLCQLYRAALLRDRADRLEISVRDAIRAIEGHCAEEDLTLPGGRRYPIRVELKDYATTIARKDGARPNGLLEYFAQNIQSVTTYQVDVRHLRRWLAAVPWLLVLDGLDEVPSSANRADVIEDIHDLLIDLHDENADVVIVATTRPQGYAGDLGTEAFEQWYLSPLSLARAMRCARRFAEANMGEPEQQRVHDELTRASANDSTARLMRSPLQVTILATLAASGPVPQDRWRLFDAYYNTIYNREASKVKWRVLETNREDINAIHNTVGLLLQVECERTGQTDARLSRTRFEAIVDQRLSDEEVEGDQLRQLKHDIVEASSERLVFLVGLAADQVGFEIRSLQEFMAARALLDGSEGMFLERLSAIAPIVHWRNVVVFAAAFCFTFRQSLRDSVVGLCSSMNQADDESLLTLPGSQLALDLMEAGIASNQAKYWRTLAVEASKLLDRPQSDLHSRLARLVPLAEKAMHEELRRRVESGRPKEQSGAWRTLLELIRADSDSWAIGLADANWPDDPETQLGLIIPQMRVSLFPWLRSRLAILIPRMAPNQLEFPILFLNFKKAEPTEWLDAVLEWVGSSLQTLWPFSKSDLGFMTIPEWARKWAALNQVPAGNNAWQFLHACVQFASQPDSATLASALSVAVDCWPVPLLLRQVCRLPWPIATVLLRCSTREQLESSIPSARDGKLGNRETWLKAEGPLARLGFLTSDICELHLPSDPPYSFPLRYTFRYRAPVRLAAPFSGSTPESKPLLRLFNGWIAGEQWEVPVGLLLRFSTRKGDLQSRLPEIIEWLREAPMPVPVGRIGPKSSTPQERLEEYEMASRFARFSGRLADAELPMVIERFSTDPENSPLVRLLAHLATERPIHLPEAIQARLWSRQTEPDSVSILLAQGPLTGPQSSELAARLAKLAGETKDLADRVFLAAKRSDDVARRLALDLSFALSPSQSDARASAVRALDDVQRRQRSPLTSAANCRKLQLPAALYNGDDYVPAQPGA